MILRAALFAAALFAAGLFVASPALAANYATCLLDNLPGVQDVPRTRLR